MRVRGFHSAVVLGMLMVASCSVSVPDDSLSDESSGELRDENVGSSQQAIRKGRAGAVNGMADYCNDPANPCNLGEGDCDSDGQCAPGIGLSCVANNGPKFGFPATWDVCAGAHCNNGVMDGDETAADCGGSCGTCSSCVGTPGGSAFCGGCLCAAGEGDCDSSSECASGLVCGHDNGPQFGLPRDYDVCVPTQCSNGILDAADGETEIDEGGPCGTRSSTCTSAPASVDSCVGCRCASGQGDCDSSAECATGLTCAANNGPKFGLPSSFDICVPAHCTNNVQDAASGENGVDVGGPCGTLCGNGAVNSGEACDDGVNDGVLCSADCSSATEVGQIRWDCASNAGIITGLSGTGCTSFPNSGASYLTFSSASVIITLYRDPNCMGSSKVTVSNTNFCGAIYDDRSAGLNDNVQSARVTRR